MSKAKTVEPGVSSKQYVSAGGPAITTHAETRRIHDCTPSSFGHSDERRPKTSICGDGLRAHARTALESPAAGSVALARASRAGSVQLTSDRFTLDVPNPRSIVSESGDFVGNNGAYSYRVIATPSGQRRPPNRPSVTLTPPRGSFEERNGTIVYRGVPIAEPSGQWSPAWRLCPGVRIDVTYVRAGSGTTYYQAVATLSYGGR